MATSNSDLKFYLTSVEPEVEQTVRSQSLGGYPAIVPTILSKSLVYPETSLTEGVGFDNLTLLTSSQISGDPPYVSINGEIIKVSDHHATSIDVDQRAVNGVSQIHKPSDIVRGVWFGLSGLLDMRFNDSFKQYRCIALRNNGTSDITDVKIYLKQNSRSTESMIRLALEVPVNDYLTGTVGSNSSDQKTVYWAAGNLGDSSADNHYINSVMRFTSGRNISQSRIISSFDSDTGIFVLQSDLPYKPLSGESFEIDPTPAQRVRVGTEAPTVGIERVTSFSTPTPTNPLVVGPIGESSPGVSSIRDHSLNLNAKDVVYLWIEHSMLKTAEAFAGNSATISIRYTVV